MRKHSSVGIFSIAISTIAILPFPHSHIPIIFIIRWSARTSRSTTSACGTCCPCSQEGLAACPRAPRAGPVCREPSHVCGLWLQRHCRAPQRGHQVPRHCRNNVRLRCFSVDCLCRFLYLLFIYLFCLFVRCASRLLNNSRCFSIYLLSSIIVLVVYLLFCLFLRKSVQYVVDDSLLLCCFIVVKVVVAVVAVCI